MVTLVNEYAGDCSLWSLIGLVVGFVSGIAYNKWETMRQNQHDRP